MWRAPRPGPVAAICAVALAACAPISLGDGERRIALRELGTSVIVPQLFELAAVATPMIHDMERAGAIRIPFYLAEARDRWREVRRAWKRAEVFGFGPAEGRLLELDRPADLAQIEAELAGEAPLDAAYVASLPGPRRGFHAIEYFLFREDGDDAAVLAALAAERRRQYLVAATRDLVARIGEVRDEWTDVHADRLATPGADDPSYPTIDRAIGVVVGECAAVAGRLADVRLDAPGGLTAGAPRPELQESARSDNSIADMADALRGLRNVYLGTRSGAPGAGLTALVAAAAPEADARARAAIEDALAATLRVPAPYRAALAEGRPEVAAAHAAVVELRRILASDVTPVLAGATMPAD